MADRQVMNLRGTALEENEIAAFTRSLRGEVIRPGDVRYESARRVWNGMIDRRPALIVYCAGADDVVRSVRFARSRELLIAVRSGGHNVAGNSVCDGGMVIDLSGMKGIEVNVLTRTAHAEAGLNWGEFDGVAQAHGLATTGGIVSRTGIAGLTLGGGIGWLVRKFGVTCDNLLSVKLVTAGGELLTASEGENEDLFWGVRGGGGNFGIATEFGYRLDEVGPVLAGTIYYSGSKVRELLRFYRDYVTAVPDELTTMFAYIAASAAPFHHALLHGSPVAAIHVCYAGSAKEGEKVVKPLRELGPPIEDTVKVMPYVALQSMLDAGSPPGLGNYWKSAYLRELSDEAIEVFSAFSGNSTSMLTQVHLQHLGGAVQRSAEDAMAFSHRDALFVLNIVTKWRDLQTSERHIQWTREFESAMRPFSTGGVYVNFLGEEGEERVRAAYGPSKYLRLAALKRKYDPANMFRLNQNIRPA